MRPDQLRIAAAFMPQGLKAVMAEGDALDSSMAEARASTDLGDRPLAVLSALRPPTEQERGELKLTEAEGVAVQAMWDTLHAEELRYSSKSWRVRLPDAGHYIQFDRPDVVIAAVREVVDSVRARER
jgi:pimeloyl-ACP methyl ester carboxylesterase